MSSAISKVHLVTIAVTALIVLLGTVYSVINHTYLDTSNPHITTLPHHLHATDYFANKKNPLNVYFTKRLWGWTTATFIFHFLTSPRVSRTRTRLAQYLVATTIWLAFTSWFFGPSLFDRLTTSTGGVCILHLPSGEHLDVPSELCIARMSISPKTHPTLFPASLLPDGQWAGMPRLRRGHDVSGHIFLLTVSTYFLVDQLRSSFSSIPGARAWPPSHKWAVAFTVITTAVSLFAIYTTSVYFHTPSEKFTGYVLGLLACMVVHLPSYLAASPATASRRPVAPARRAS